MQIDGFTFIAQIINFVILLVLLRITLYKPILNVMSQREERLKAQISDAENLRKQADEDVRALRTERQQLEDQRADLLAQAKRDAEAYRHELQAQARQHVDSVRARWLDDIEREKREFFQDLQRRTASEVVAIARDALRGLANAELERQIIARFVEQLETISDDERAALEQEARDQPLTLRSAFALHEDDQRRIEEALGDGVALQVEQTRDLICGVELKTPRYEIAWSVDSYLDTLNDQVTEALSEIAHDTAKQQ